MEKIMHRAVRNRNEKTGDNRKFTTENILFILSGVILLCSFLFSGYVLVGYIQLYKSLVAMGVLIAAVILLSGSYLAFLSYGIYRILKQNRQIIEKLERLQNFETAAGKDEAGGFRY